MALKLAGSTFSFMWGATALESLRQMAVIGLSGFDVLLSPGHLWFDINAAERRELRDTLAGEGLRLESLNLPAIDLNLASMSPQVRAFSVRAYLEAIDLAADLGAGGVVVVPGRISALLPPPRAAVLAHLTREAQTLIGRAGPRNLQLFFELHPQSPLPHADLLGEWVEALDAPCTSIAYDVANAAYVGEDPASAIRKWSHRIGQYHLSDSSRSIWRHDPFGRGEVRFAEIADALRQTGFSGACVLEIISPEPIADISHAMRVLTPQS